MPRQMVFKGESRMDGIKGDDMESDRQMGTSCLSNLYGIFLLFMGVPFEILESLIRE